MKKQQQQEQHSIEKSTSLLHILSNHQMEPIMTVFNITRNLLLVNNGSIWVQCLFGVSIFGLRMIHCQLPEWINLLLTHNIRARLKGKINSFYKNNRQGNRKCQMMKSTKAKVIQSRRIKTLPPNNCLISWRRSKEKLT